MGKCERGVGAGGAVRGELVRYCVRGVPWKLGVILYTYMYCVILCVLCNTVCEVYEVCSGSSG